MVLSLVRRRGSESNLTPNDKLLRRERADIQANAMPLAYLCCVICVLSPRKTTGRFCLNIPVSQGNLDNLLSHSLSQSSHNHPPSNSVHRGREKYTGSDFPMPAETNPEPSINCTPLVLPRYITYKLTEVSIQVQTERSTQCAVNCIKLR